MHEGKQTMIKGATYDYQPCKKCGGVKRYVSNGNCPVCMSAANQRLKARKAASEGRSYTPRRVAAPITTKPATAPHKPLQRLLKWLFMMPLNIFNVGCKYKSTQPV